MCGGGGLFCSDVLPSGSSLFPPALLCPEGHGGGPLSAAAGGSRCSVWLPRGVPSCVCSKGCRPDLGSFVGGALCVSSSGAKKGSVRCRLSRRNSRPALSVRTLDAAGSRRWRGGELSPACLGCLKCRSPCLCECSCMVCDVDLNARSLFVGEPLCRNLTCVHLDLCCLCEPLSDWTKEQRIGERPDTSAGGHPSANLECGGALVFLPRPVTAGVGIAAAAASWCSHTQPRR